MQLYSQIGLVAIPLLGAALIGTNLIQPAMEESGQKAGQLETIHQQYEILEIKLKQKHKLMAKRKFIHNEIAKLRSSVPEKPDLDLLMLDLEKMCKTNEVKLLGVEEFVPGRAGKQKKTLMESLVHEAGGKMPVKLGLNQKNKQNNRKNQKKEEEKEKDPLGLKHTTRRVYISGSFNGLVGVLKNLESYQRIVGIRELVVAMPEDQDKEVEKTLASERGKELNLNEPVMTFLLHIYYLPS